MNEQNRARCEDALRNMSHAIGEGRLEELKSYADLVTAPSPKKPFFKRRRDLIVTLATLIGIAIATAVELLTK